MRHLSIIKKIKKIKKNFFFFLGGIFPPKRGKKALLGSNVFQANVTIFELIQDIIETNLLTKFHEDWIINVTSNVDATQRTTDDGQKAITNAHHEHVVLR
ncbi:hypothetical protein DPMN_037500 [Dreissena polymorpha]|uniref:Uncharacterized protein n=1 Tax=Dreissena polymorpha TaxID=45954 RepID=A0A9D4RP82_DREPO|nr:hypothetical protein DPMN_037500 [Dreissena polymorpha]